MQPFTRHAGVVFPLDRIDVDTNQILPNQFLKRITRTGYEDALFYDWRTLPNGEPNPDFPLNWPRYRGASIIVAGRNFGGGSSREHAVWALRDYGFRAVIASAIGDIFRSNCYQNGVLPLVLPEEVVRQIMTRAQEIEGYSLVVDLEAQTASDELGLDYHFDFDPFRRTCLLQGLDDIGLTLRHEQAIAAYEARRPAWLPTTTAAR